MPNITGPVLDHKEIDSRTATRDTIRVVSTSRAATASSVSFFVWTQFLVTKKKTAAKTRRALLKMMVKPVFFFRSLQPKLSLSLSLSLMCSHGTQRGYRCSPTQRNQIRKKRGDQTSEDQNNICGPSEKDFWDAIRPDYIVALYIRLSKLAACVCVFAALVLDFTEMLWGVGAGRLHRIGPRTKKNNVSQIKHRISAKEKSLNRENKVRLLRMGRKDGRAHKYI